MRIRTVGLIGAVLAFVSAQAVDAVPLSITPGHIDPLLSLSLLASEHSRTIACARSESAAGAEMAFANANCASEAGGGEGVDTGAMGYGQLAPAHASWLALLSPAIFASGWFVFMTEMTHHNIHFRKPVSPD